jgi:AmmeMemoRadiSam system protein A
VFVTLRAGNELRGCIGILEPARPLAEAVAQCAAAAATEDPRFPPLSRDELGRVSIEISALAAPVPVSDPGQVVLGRHGLLVSRGRRRGVLLPQVPVEQGWDLATFLRETCLKAGLPPDAWRSGARLEAFGAEVFGEEEPRGGPPGTAPQP